MKTLREYIDQLDEISRRDFLKGAGATAGLAAIGDVQAQKSRYTSADINTIKEGVEAYFWMTSQEPAPGKQMWGIQRTKSALDKIAKNPEGKKIILDTWNKLRKSGLPDEIITDMLGRGTMTTRVQKLEQLAAFDNFSQGPAPTDQQLASVRRDMAMEEDLEETASPDAVKRIEDLVNYK